MFFSFLFFFLLHPINGRGTIETINHRLVTSRQLELGMDLEMRYLDKSLLGMHDVHVKIQLGFQHPDSMICSQGVIRQVGEWAGRWAGSGRRRRSRRRSGSQLETVETIGRPTLICSWPERFKKLLMTLAMIQVTVTSRRGQGRQAAGRVSTIEILVASQLCGRLRAKSPLRADCSSRMRQWARMAAATKSTAGRRLGSWNAGRARDRSGRIIVGLVLDRS